MKTKLVPVRLYHVFSADGQPLGFFKVDGELDGVARLRRIEDGARLLVHYSRSLREEISGYGVDVHADIISASPDLLERLLPPSRKEATCRQPVERVADCRHPVLVDNPHQPGVNDYICARCDARVLVDQFHVERARRRDPLAAFPS